MEERDNMSLSENDITPGPGEEEQIPTPEPGEGEIPPQESDPPAGEEEHPVGGFVPSHISEGDTGNEMQLILEDFRESFGDQDADITALTESVRALTDAMNIKTLSVDDLPFEGWREWRYPVRMEYTVHPWGAGHDMEQTERIETSDALLARYNEILGLVGNAGDGKTLQDFYVRYIFDDIDSDEEILVYDWQSVKEPVQEIEVPFEGWEGWSYPVTVDFTVHPWGAGYEMEQTETLETAEAFRIRYGEILELCKDGGTLKDFYVRRIRDANGETVYDQEALTPDPDPGDEELKETAEKLLIHLEDINTTLEEMVQADLEYQQAAAEYREKMLELQTADTGATIILCIAMFAVFAELIMKHLLEGIR